MANPRITRRQIIKGAAAVGAFGALGLPSAAFADGGKEGGRTIRWDLVTFGGGAVVPTGTDVSTDAASSDTLSLTGSGFAWPHRRKASGGGTYVHRHADGSLVSQGVVVVTGFNSFSNGGGSLNGLGLTDTIGKLDQTTGGVLSLNMSVAGTPITAVLEVHCTLPGGQPDTEGVRVVVAQFGLDFRQTSGATLFHVLED